MGRRFKSGCPDQQTQVREAPGFGSGASFDLREPLREHYPYSLRFPVTQDSSSPMALSAGEVPRLTESLPTT